MNNKDCETDCDSGYILHYPYTPRLALVYFYAT